MSDPRARFVVVRKKGVPMNKTRKPRMTKSEKEFYRYILDLIKQDREAEIHSVQWKVWADLQFNKTY